MDKQIILLNLKIFKGWISNDSHCINCFDY